MSSSERAPSRGSTVIESAKSTSPGQGDGVLPHSSIDEKLDPWLVSFSPDDPDDPLVRCASWSVLRPS